MIMAQNNENYLDFLNNEDETIVQNNIALSNFLGDNIYNEDDFY